MRLAALSTPCILLCLGALPGPALGFNDGLGREWRPVPQARPAGSPVSWAQVAAFCPVDGLTPCQGTLGTVKLEGWVWATRPQVLALFGVFAPDILTSPTQQVGGPTYRQAAAQAQAALGYTAHYQGCPTYQPCFNVKFLVGMSASLLEGSSTPVAWGGQVVEDLWDGGSGLGLIAPLPASVPYGLWMWRPTGLSDGSVHANDDAGSPTQPGGGVAVADVLANDWAAGQRATTQLVTLEPTTQTVAGVWLQPSGAVQVEPGTAAGSYGLGYRICLRADATRCDDAQVSVTVRSFALTAVADSGSIAFAQGGVAIANVLANDRLGTVVPTPAMVTLSTVSASHPGLSLDAATGALRVAAGTPSGVQSLRYRVCERANPANCAEAQASVQPHAIDAVNDYARGSSKVANTPLASVLSNDRFKGAAASLAQVSLARVSLTPANSKIRLNLSTGAVEVLGKTDSGLYSLVYKICERASPTNCDTATVTLELSGRGD